MEHQYQKKEKIQLATEKPDYLEVYCPNCYSALNAEAINIHDKIAKCISCNIVFAFELDQAKIIDPRPFPEEILRPEGVDIFRYKGELDFTFSESYNDGSAALVFILSLFTLFLTFAHFNSGLAIWVPILAFLFTGIAIQRAVIRSKIILSIDQQNLSLKKRPKKMQQDQVYPIHKIDQIYIQKMDGTDYYDLYMIINTLKEKKHIQLVRGLETHSKAKYLEQEIENHLGIEDRLVNKPPTFLEQRYSDKI